MEVELPKALVREATALGVDDQAVDAPTSEVQVARAPMVEATHS